MKNKIKYKYFYSSLSLLKIYDFLTCFEGLLEEFISGFTVVYLKNIINIIYNK
jgi:hypothetical protein